MQSFKDICQCGLRGKNEEKTNKNVKVVAKSRNASFISSKYASKSDRPFNSCWPFPLMRQPHKARTHSDKNSTKNNFHFAFSTSP